jgi:capping protein (actin filament) muscle Z-line, beta
MLQLITRSGNDSGSAASKEDLKKGPEGLKTDGEVTLSGSMTRQTEQDWPLQDGTSHITNTGKMIEEMEIKMRSLLQEVRLVGLLMAFGTCADHTQPLGLLWQNEGCGS